MVTELSRRDGLKVLAAIAGGSTAALLESDEDVDELVPVGGGGGPMAADLTNYRLYSADSYADVSDAKAPALVVISGGTENGIVEVR